MQKKLSRSSWLLAGAGAGGILILYSLYWITVAHIIQNWINDAQKGFLRDPRITFSGQLSDVSGFPFHFRTTGQSVQLKTASLEVTVPEFEAITSAKPWRLHKTDFTLAKGLTASILNSTPATLETTHLKARLYRSGNLLPKYLSFTVINYELRSTDPDIQNRLGTQIERARIAVFPHRPETRILQDTEISFRIFADNAAPPPFLKDILNETIDHFEMNARLIKLPTGLPNEIVLRDWQQYNGAIDITKLVLSWGPLDLKGQGKLRLDRNLQPEGEIKLKAAGLTWIFDGLARAGILKENPTKLMMIGLSMFSNRNAPDARPSFTLPVIIKNRRVFIGPVVALELPEFVWSCPAIHPACAQ